MSVTRLLTGRYVKLYRSQENNVTGRYEPHDTAKDKHYFLNKALAENTVTKITHHAKRITKSQGGGGVIFKPKIFTMGLKPNDNQ
jgi:tRNA U34 2-thiouridine synthase MnmA/TrmU